MWFAARSVVAVGSIEREMIFSSPSFEFRFVSFQLFLISFASMHSFFLGFNLVIWSFFVVLDKGNVLGQIVDVFLVKVVPLLGLEALAFPPSLFVAVVVKHEV